MALSWSLGRRALSAVRLVSMFKSRLDIATIHLHRSIQLDTISMAITLRVKLSRPEPHTLSPLDPLEISLTIVENHNSRRPQHAKTRQDPHPKRRSRISRPVRRDRPSLITAHDSESSVATQPSRSRDSIVDHERGDDEHGTDACPGVEERVCIAGSDQIVVPGVIEGYYVSMGLQVFGQGESGLHVSERLGVDRYGYGHVV